MAISGIISSITTTITSVISWFMQVLPPPLRIAFFLFFIIFVVSTVMGFSMGLFYSCDSIGNAYKMSSITIDSQVAMVQYGVEQCRSQNTTVAYTFFGGITGLGARLYNWVTSSEDVCDRLLNNTELTQNARDTILRSAERVQIEQGMSVGCVQDSDGTASWYYPSLKWYGINILDKRLWLLGSILTLLAPLAFWWYHTILKK
jgi:hypothetical protein